MAPRKPEQRTSAFDQEQTATAAVPPSARALVTGGGGEGHGGGVGNTAAARPATVATVDALFLIHMESLFAAGGLHSFLWPDNTRFNESRVPYLAGTDDHDNPSCRL